jgi:Flp pilus assembly protein TadD
VRPDDPDLLLELGMTLVRAGQDSAAVAPLTQVVRQLPRNYRAEYYLGLIARRARRTADARAHLRRFLQLAPRRYQAQIEDVQGMLGATPATP